MTSNFYSNQSNHICCPLGAKLSKTNKSIQFFVIEKVGLHTNFTQITQALLKIEHFEFLPLDRVLYN